jgi:phosphopantothenoylcysteine synthetase/decarboxylase
MMSEYGCGFAAQPEQYFYDEISEKFHKRFGEWVLTPMEHREVIVTAGGTREQIDDVRYIGNFSGGRLGHSLAAQYAWRGHKVLLLAPERVVDRFGLPEGVEHEPFTSAESLRDRLLAQASARLILHAAAVADYMPERTYGKLSSENEELTLQLKRTPKILPSLRDHFGSETTIVGFKLLSGVREEELIEAATGQIQASGTDLCIANDLQNIGKQREVHIVQPDGHYGTIRGTNEGVARSVYASLEDRLAL